MGTINPALPTLGGPRGDGETAVRSALSTLLNEFNGNVDTANVKDSAITSSKLAQALADLIGVSGANVRRGYSSVAGPISITSTTPVNSGAAVDVNGPTNGIALIAAKADLLAPAAANAIVSLGIDGLDYGDLMNTTSTSFTSLWAAPGSVSGVAWPRGGLIVQDFSGARGFRLNVRTSSGTAQFRNLGLWVLTIGF